MVSFIHSGSEITSWMGIASKPEHKIRSNIFKIRTSFLNWAIPEKKSGGSGYGISRGIEKTESVFSRG